MSDPRQSTFGDRTSTRPKRSGNSYWAIVVFAVVFAILFVRDAAMARSVRGELEAAVGGRSVRLVDIKESRAKCGSYRIGGDPNTWLFVRDDERLWPQSVLPSQELPPAVLSEFAACDTYHSGRSGSTLWFTPEVLAVANWRDKVR